MDSPNAASETDRSTVPSYPWCLCLTTFQEFMLWNPPAVEWLRRSYRIIGRASQSYDNTMRNGNSVSTGSRGLPVRLSFEETVLLLTLGVIQGLQLAVPLDQCNPPDRDQLDAFAEALKRNASEMLELSKVKRRLELTGKYRQLLGGLSVRAARQAASDRSEGESDSARMSVRMKRRARRLQSKAMKSHTADHVQLGLETHLEDDADCSPEGDVATDPEPEIPGAFHDRLLTLDNLIEYYNSCRSSASSSSCNGFDDPILRHLPRATPVELRRPNELQRVPLPALVKSGGLFSIASWLWTQVQLSGTDSPAASSMSDSLRTPCSEHRLARCKVFHDLWTKGAYVTTCTKKMGGDFLIYPGDPLKYHASHIVYVTSHNAVVQPQHIAAKLRLANTVRKILVLASCPNLSAESDGVAYTSLAWSGGPKRTGC